MWASLLPGLPRSLVWVVVIGLVVIALARGVGPEARRWVEMYWKHQAELRQRE